ncbi:MAG: hypothetical protein QOF48_1756, partial [Verrucomicrobiota bacterium]
MKKFPLRSCFVLLAGFAGFQIQAQPANDLFANRITITTVTTNVTTSNVGAGTETGEDTQTCVRLGASLWWRWTAPVSGSVRITTIGSSFDTVLDVFTGAAVNALTQVACDDNGGGSANTSVVTFNATQGVQYQIRTSGRRIGGGFTQTGTLQFNISMPPTLTITAPANNVVLPTGSNFVFSATAAAQVGSISRVDFYRNGALLGSDSSSPYSVTVSNAALGSNIMTAVVMDTFGQSVSSTVTVVVLANGVTITAPTDGTTYLTANPITINAAAAVSGGSVTNVQFLVDGVVVGQDATAPFSISWGSVTPGLHRLTGTGRDTSGILYTSAAVTISVARALLTSNSVWKYLDNGSDQGSTWSAPNFDDSGWSTGQAPLGYGDSNGRLPLTTTGYGPDLNNKFVTTYFRQTFIATNASSYTNLVLHFERDDASIIYINGIEVSRINLPAGTITSTTYALANAADDGTTLFTINLPAAYLVEGANVVAVEMHQDAPNSSDIWMVMDILGIPSVVRNQPPNVTLTNPANNGSFLEPSGVLVSASASDADNMVTNVALHVVDLYGNDLFLGNIATPPYEAAWNSPTQGWYNVYAVASDELGAVATSAAAFVTIYDAVGTPRIQIFTPTNGVSYDGPTNVALFAGTTAANGVTNVDFQANGVTIGRLPFPTLFTPVSASYTWTNAAFGTQSVVGISYDASGLTGTSAPVTIIVHAPPPNLDAPTITGVIPARGNTLGSLSLIQVTFSEKVVGVNPSDLLVNGIPASTVVGSGSNYTFTVASPGPGTAAISWVANHGIVDLGVPSLAFDATAPGATWNYNIVDLAPPTIASLTPTAGSTVNILTQISVTFSEAVTGVDAADLLINGSPAIGLNGGGANYIFSFSQPASTAVTVSWATGHGITDLSPAQNAFNGGASSWTYTLDNRTVLVQSNGTWRFIKAFAEASSPIDAWRQNDFNDSAWANSLAPFYYGDPYNSVTDPGTPLTDMLGGSYSSIYMRTKFVLNNASAVTNLFLNAQSDDGFIAWINGVELLRYGMAAGDIPYNGSALTAVNEPNNRGAAYILYSFPNPGSYLTDGTNVLAIHAFNNQPATSSDFGINAQLYTYLADPSLVSPRVASVFPSAGDVFYLTNIIITFTEPVANVDAADLLINGVAAISVTGGASNNIYSFRFAQPAFGQVNITWAPGHGIVDFDATPKGFDETSAGSAFQYSLQNPSAPVVASQTPVAGVTVTNLNQLAVTFNEAVTGVGAQDLLVNGIPATGISGGPAVYSFTFPQPPFGPVSIAWAANHGIADIEIPANAFDASRPGSTWSYNLVDQVPPVIASVFPSAGATVTNLTSVSVTFSKPVAGVNAADLLLNGSPAGAVTGAGAGPYTFTFAQPNAVVINVTWAVAHGIHDLAVTPNSFNSTAAGATWNYLTPDNVPPQIASIDPAPFVTVRTLTTIRVTFTEAVFGVDTNDLLLNNRRATQVTGSGAGPYTFNFAAPSNGPVEVRWVSTNGITDLAGPPNSFAGGDWTYVVDPTAAFAGDIVINEIMFDPPGGSTTNEWIELRNVTGSLINLTGWRFTKGVGFTFPNVSIAANGYLVVAANLAAFQSQHPGVNNVVGGWTGSLANSAETLEFKTALGEAVNSVSYASEGDWARRERGNGASAITSITRNGTTATVTVFNHGYNNNDQVVITGANQPEYNGRFTVGGASSTTFTISVASTAATPATGNIVSHQVHDNGASGWSWYSPAAGFGSSLELVNPDLSNNAGQNWLPSLGSGGTPGVANSVATNNVAPLIANVTHFPPIPRAGVPVAITARVRDELSNGVASVVLFFRNHTSGGPPGFSSAAMLDDGGHSDGVPNDGLYGAVLPSQVNGTVIEFYVQATDIGGRVRTWPAPSYETNGPSATYGNPGQFANAMYQVDNEIITNTMPAIRLVLSGTERALFPPSDRSSDASPNCTMITTDGEGTRVRYLCDTRVRGAGTRTRTPPNNRIGIPADNTWNGLGAINLNSQFVHAQLLGNSLALKSGVPAEPSYVVQYRINGVNPAPINPPSGSAGAGWGTFLLLEPPNGDVAVDLFPLDGSGNYYRASTTGHNADFTYQNGDPAAYVSRGYYKTSNRTENNWSDFIALTLAMNMTGANSDYVNAISTNVNVVEWMRYFALSTLMNDGETKLANGIGDDYALYRGEVDKRFVIIDHDFDTIFGQGDTGSGYYPINTNASIFIMLNPPNTGSGGSAPTVPLLRRL